MKKPKAGAKTKPKAKPAQTDSFDYPRPTWNQIGKLPEDVRAAIEAGLRGESKPSRGNPKSKGASPRPKASPKSKSGRIPPLRKPTQAELMAAEERLYRGYDEGITSDTPDYADFGGNGHGSAVKMGGNGFVNENPLQKYDNLVTKVMTLETWCEFLAQKQKIMDATMAQLIARIGPTLPPQRGIRG